ncbi:uncharacterized protein TNCV_1450201 [Trichonephila clavipes]|nr:uncharacterized protein TNCV_1450201 [Trichonephila clavipes]
MSSLAFFAHANVFHHGGQPVPVELSIASIPEDGTEPKVMCITVDHTNLLTTDKDRRANRYINERLSLKSHLPGSVPLEYLDFCVRGKFCHLAQGNRGLIVVKGSDQRKIFEKLGLFTINLEILPHFRDLNDHSLPDHLHDDVHEDFNISECTMVKSYRFARYLQYFNKLQAECKKQTAHLVERRRDVQINVNDWVLVAKHPLSSATRKVVAKFKPKFEGPYRVLDVKNNNVVIWKAGKRLTINVDQVRIYRHRKYDETEIGTGSSDNGSLRDESSGFDKVQRRSNESRDGKKKGSKVKRELEEKGLSFRNNQGETQIRPISADHLSDQYLVLGLRKRMIKKKEKPRRIDSDAHHKRLQPQTAKWKGSGERESRPTIERKTQQGGPVRSRKGRERNDSPYIEERTRSSNKNARRGGDQQRQDQERRGTYTKKSLSLCFSRKEKAFVL